MNNNATMTVRHGDRNYEVPAAIGIELSRLRGELTESKRLLTDLWLADSDASRRRIESEVFTFLVPGGTRSET